MHELSLALSVIEILVGHVLLICWLANSYRASVSESRAVASRAKPKQS